MEMFIDFLTNNYMWFLVITLFLIFSLIGYIVDSREQKNMNVFGGTNIDREKDFERLAASAQNKTLGEVLQNQTINQTDQGFINTSNSIINSNNNIISNQSSVLNNSNTSANSSLEILGK